MRKHKVALVTAVFVLGAASCGGSSSKKPEETFKQAQAAVATPFAALMETLARDGDAVVATDRLIVVVREHQDALGPKETRRSFAVTAYAIDQLDVGPECVQKLRDEAANVDG